MDLREVVTGRLRGELGPDARVVEWLVDHPQRCVGEVLLGDGRRVAAKADVEARAIAREVAVLRAGRDGGVPLPAVLAEWIEPEPAMFVAEWLEGDWLAPERPERAWAAAGATLRRLHDVDVPGLGFFGREPSWTTGMAAWFAWERRQAHEVGVEGAVAGAIDAVGAALDRLATEHGPPIGTLHADCGPIHWRLDGDDQVVGLIDLGTAMRGDPAYDLTVLTLRTPERLPAVLDGYGADEALRRWVERSLVVYRAFRHLGEVVWLAQHDFDPSNALGELDAAVADLG
jgi:aminoglycoside phosphotransferase (APT) family kinase protein